MPVATAEQLGEWYLDAGIGGCDLVVYLTDGQCAAARSAHEKYYGVKKSIDDIMLAEILSLGLDPLDFKSFSDAPFLAQRAQNALVFVAAGVKGSGAGKNRPPGVSA